MSNGKILIVDDEEDIVELLKVRLEANNYKVITAGNAYYALDKIKDRPDIILLDVMMPAVDGFQLLKRLKKDKNTKSIPVIMLTCKKDAESLFKAEELEAADYLIKPVDPQELLRVIKKHTE